MARENDQRESEAAPRKVVILSSGNSIGMGSGYGGQTTLIAAALREAGHVVFVVSWSSFIHQGAVGEIMAYPFRQLAPMLHAERNVTPRQMALFQEDTFVIPNPFRKWPIRIPKASLNAMIAKVNADLFIAFQDIYLFEPGPLIVPSVVWMPFHFRPVEDTTLMSLDGFDTIVAITEYGRLFASQSLSDAHVPASRAKQIHYIPHGRNLDIFRPVETSAERAALRERLGWPRDAFVVLMVAANTEESNRKAWDIQLQAWCKFAQRFSGETFLHVHSDPFRAEGGYDLLRILQIFGEFPDRDRFVLPDGRYTSSLPSNWDRDRGVRGPRVQFTPPSLYGALPERDMAAMYQAADVLLEASCAEGFGVPVIEAQLCGCPVVSNNTTSMTELTQFGVRATPHAWIMRRDFQTGWDQPSLPNLIAALERVAAWTPAERIRGLRQLQLANFRERYSDRAVEQQWGAFVAKGVFRRPENVCRTHFLALGERIKTAAQLQAEAQTEVKRVLEQYSKVWTMASHAHSAALALTRPERRG